MDLDYDRPCFCTRDIAEILGTKTNYVRDQVKARKLIATVNRKWNSRTLLRFSLNDVIRYDPDAGERLLLREMNREQAATSDVPQGTCT